MMHLKRIFSTNRNPLILYPHLPHVFDYSWSSPRLQIWRYVSDRTGVISMANMPLIWAFSMRNNVLIWLTGWSFSTFNCFHRWVARIATVEAIVHSFGYSVFAVLSKFRLSTWRISLMTIIPGGGTAQLYADWAEQYWWMGGIVNFTLALFDCIDDFLGYFADTIQGYCCDESAVFVFILPSTAIYLRDLSSHPHCFRSTILGLYVLVSTGLLRWITGDEG